MKKQITSLFVLSIIAFFTSQSVSAQQKQDRYIFSIGKGLESTDWQLRFKVGAGREYQLGYGFSLTALAELSEYPNYQPKGNTFVRSHATSYSLGISGTLKLSPPWDFSPYLAWEMGWSAIRQGETVTASLFSAAQQNPAKWLGNVFISLSAGADMFFTNTFSTFFELKISNGGSNANNNFNSNTLVRGGIGLVL